MNLNTALTTLQSSSGKLSSAQPSSPDSFCIYIGSILQCLLQKIKIRISGCIWQITHDAKGKWFALYILKSYFLSFFFFFLCSMERFLWVCVCEFWTMDSLNGLVMRRLFYMNLWTSLSILINKSWTNWVF